MAAPTEVQVPPDLGDEPGPGRGLLGVPESRVGSVPDDSRGRPTASTRPRLEVSDCCCLRIPQVIEGRPLPVGEQILVMPQAWFYHQQANGPMFGRTPS